MFSYSKPLIIAGLTGIGGIGITAILSQKKKSFEEAIVVCGDNRFGSDGKNEVGKTFDEALKCLNDTAKEYRK